MTMTYDDWVETYKPIQNHIVERGTMDGTIARNLGPLLNKK